jgi:hypothetical protein
VRTKALTHEQNESLREIVREVIQRDFGGKVSVAAAKDPKISHSLLFEFLDDRRGAGMKLLEWISARTGRGIDDLLGRVVATVYAESEVPEASNAAGWDEAEREAREENPHYPPWLWEKVRGARSLRLASPVTKDAVAELASYVWRRTDLQEKARLEGERIERSNETLRKSAATKARKKLLAGSPPSNDPAPLQLTAPKTPKASKKNRAK